MRLCFVTALVAACSFCSAQTIRLSTSSFASLYGALRAAQEPGAALPAGKLGDAVNDLAKLEASFPEEFRARSGSVVRGDRERVNALYWRTIDAIVYGASSIDELISLRAHLPEQIGGSLETGATINAVIGAMRKAQTTYDAQMWPAEKVRLEEHFAYWKLNGAPHAAEALKWIADTLGTKSAPESIDVVIVPNSAGKEGMTVRTQTGIRVIIGAGKYDKDDFAEVVLHEATHVLDAMSPSDGFLFTLRRALRDAKRSEFQIEQAPHTAIFLLAAEATRKFIEQAHVDVGQTQGAYSRGLEPLRLVVAPELERLWKGRQSREAAVSAIVRGLSP